MQNYRNIRFVPMTDNIVELLFAGQAPLLHTSLLLLLIIFIIMIIIIYDEKYFSSSSTIFIAKYH